MKAKISERLNSLIIHNWCCALAGIMLPQIPSDIRVKSAQTLDKTFAHIDEKPIGVTKKHNSKKKEKNTQDNYAHTRKSRETCICWYDYWQLGLRSKLVAQTLLLPFGRRPQMSSF